MISCCFNYEYNLILKYNSWVFLSLSYLFNFYLIFKIYDNFVIKILKTEKFVKLQINSWTNYIKCK